MIFVSIHEWTAWCALWWFIGILYSHNLFAWTITAFPIDHKSKWNCRKQKEIDSTFFTRSVCYCHQPQLQWLSLRDSPHCGRPPASPMFVDVNSNRPLDVSCATLNTILCLLERSISSFNNSAVTPERTYYTANVWTKSFIGCYSASSIFSEVIAVCLAISSFLRVTIIWATRG